MNRALRSKPLRAPLDELDAIFATVDQGQQLTYLVDVSSGLEPGSGACDLFEQGIDLVWIAPGRIGVAS